MAFPVRLAWLGFAIVAAGALPACASHDRTARADAEPWIPLFNGRNLDGWTVKIAGHELGDNFADTFRVEDGVLAVRYDRYPQLGAPFAGQFGHLFTDESYSHYRLRVEYRFVGEQCAGGPDWAWRNSGVMLHCQPPQGMRLDQGFPVSLECQLLGGDGSTPRSTANLCTPGTNVVMGGTLVTRHCTDSTSPTLAGDQWVTAEVEVRGGEVIRHAVNGQTVLQYEQPQLDPDDPDARALIRDGVLLLREGRIALQAESAPVEFRRVELLRLDG